MKDLIFDEFQNAVDNSLLRHKSILDIMTKLQESQARVNRAVIKAVTSCGCLEIQAKKQCIPNSSIPTQETGTRHRTAQRIAKQTGSIVVAISQRRNIITLYKDDIKYVVRDSSEVLARANQAIQTLEKYVSVLERVVSNLNLLELQDLASLLDVVTTIQRNEMVMRIVNEIETYICELGNEGRLISMQLGELIKDVEQEGILLVRDYCSGSANYLNVYRGVEKLSSEELLDLDAIAKILGYSGVTLVDTLISPRGYRILNKIPRIPFLIALALASPIPSTESKSS